MIETSNVDGREKKATLSFFCEILIKMFVSIDEAFMTRVEKCYKTHFIRR